MKKISLFFIALAIVLGLAVSGCYYERERPWYRPRYHQDDDHHRGYDHRDYGHRDEDDD